MILENITSNGFRNISGLNFSPTENMNVIFGNNAEGKTNLLEAIWLFCGAKSFRGAKDREMVAFGEELAVNTANFSLNGRKMDAKIIIDTKRRAELLGKKLSSPSKLAGNFYCLTFSPQDLNLVNDGPKVRRRFLDTAIGQIYPIYNELLREYVKAVLQRNSILRDIRFHPELEHILEDFEISLAQLSIKIIKYREKYIEDLSKIAPEIYAGISSGRENLEISYLSEIKGQMSTEELLKKYREKRREDIFNQNTSVGPHRDDILLKLNGNLVKSFGSQGQKRSVALSLKLSEARALKNLTGEEPIALLDDVMSELDTKRQDFILNHIEKWQVFITCCDPANILGLKNGKVFKMSGGKLHEI